jgi:hypothetical protein
MRIDMLIADGEEFPMPCAHLWGIPIHDSRFQIQHSTEIILESGILNFESLLVAAEGRVRVYVRTISAPCAHLGDSEFKIQDSTFKIRHSTFQNPSPF